jgi:hypothetical protein
MAEAVDLLLLIKDIKEARFGFCVQKNFVFDITSTTITTITINTSKKLLFDSSLR